MVFKTQIIVIIIIVDIFLLIYHKKTPLLSQARAFAKFNHHENKLSLVNQLLILELCNFTIFITADYMCRFEFLS